MTVATPTTAAFSPNLDAPRIGIRCASCGSVADAREPFCAHCGSRVAVVRAARRPADLAATRSLQFAALAVLANILLGGLSLAVVYLVADAERLTEAAVGLEIMRFLVVVTLAALAIRAGVRGIRETRDGALRRRAWAIVGIAVAGGFALLVTGSLAATTLLYLARG